MILGTNKNYCNGALFEAKIGMNLEQQIKDLGGFVDPKTLNVFIKRQMVGQFLRHGQLEKMFFNSRNSFSKAELSKSHIPDFAFYNSKTKVLTIIEVKSQTRSGTTDEKILAGPFLKSQYSKLCKKADDALRLNFIYVLNDWWKHDRYKDYLHYLLNNGIVCHFGEISFKTLL